MTESLLIIDDDKSILKALRMTLEENYFVDTAENGTDGLKLLQEKRPNLILLDIGLPDISGIDLLEKVKKLIKTLKTLKLLLTIKDLLSAASPLLALIWTGYL